MFQMLKSVFCGRPAAKVTKAARRARPEIESLEDRRVMTVTFHGGAVLPTVEVQALYEGSDWYNNSANYSQTGTLDGFLNNVVQSTYMDMLNKAGYGVGRGSASGGKIFMSNINKSYYLTDSSIRSDLLSAISATNHLEAPDANRLYVVFVEPGVAVMNDHLNNATSQSNFLGYHGAFGSSYGDIHYAVVCYPGGAVGNAGMSWLSATDDLTQVASHEIAEAVTDPNINYKTLGWYDDTFPNSDGTKGDEIGDLANAQTVHLNGYAVQRIADKNDQPMTPAGARAVNPVSFVLQTNGNLYMHSSSGLTWLDNGVASVSDQGIDNQGHAMVDVLFTNGSAYEYHEGQGWIYLTSGVRMGAAGQGVSYVLLTSGTVYEYKDSSGSWSSPISYNVTSISAGTDRNGVNMEAEIWYGQGWEWSDSSGWHTFGSGLTSISAGQQGYVDYVTGNGNGYLYTEAYGSSSLIAYNVAQMTAGTDQNGNNMIDMLYTNGNLWEYRVDTGWNWLDNSVTSIAKGRAGVVDMVFSWGDAYDHGPGGWTYLTGSARTAA
jgi:hypothetical protein